MKQNQKNAKGVNNSNTVAVVNGNLPVVEVEDTTTTKGKVSANFDLSDQAAATEEMEKLDKNAVFAEVSDYLCPVKFDDSALQAALTPLVAAGVMSEETKAAAIQKAKREFLEDHSEEIEKANNMSFTEVIANLQKNETLYKKVLSVCKVSELVENNYIFDENKVMIYRAAQCTDNEGKDRYKDVSLTREENGQKFTVSLFVEYREVTTANVVLSIRYYQSYLDALKRLNNQISDYRRILDNVTSAARKAKDNGFGKDQIFAAIESIF